jgi:hypothetical protein
VQYITLQYSTVQYSTVQYSTDVYIKLLLECLAIFEVIALPARLLCTVYASLPASLPPLVHLFFPSTVFPTLHFSFLFFLNFSSFFFCFFAEEECLNLIIGGDVIACKNKALKSFVLFPRYRKLYYPTLHTLRTAHTHSSARSLLSICLSVCLSVC